MWFVLFVAGGIAMTGCLFRKKDSTLYSPISVPAEATNSVATTTATAATNPPVIHETFTPPLAAVTNTPSPAPANPPATNNAIAADAAAHNTAAQTNVTQPAQTNLAQPIVTPAQGLSGKVASVNTAGKFVVLSFPIGQMPAFEQSLNVYRKGLKVAEVKVTGPKLDENIVADVAQGSAEIGDDVRDR
jgi:hypothetical protein